MFVRVNTVTGAASIDAGVAAVRDKVLPELRPQNGFRGLTVSGNPTTGDMGILSLWETLADLEASAGSVSQLRTEAMTEIGGQISVTTMEQMVSEFGEAPAAVGCPLRIIDTTMDPARVDEHLEFFRSQVLPGLKGAPGFRAVRYMVDRAAGQGTVGTIWADEASMQADEEGAGTRRERAKAQGVELSEPRYRTVLFSHLV